MRSWRLIVGIAAALATVGIVGALAVHRPTDSDVQGTLKSGLNTTESQSGAATGGAGVAGASATRNADEGAISTEPSDEPVAGSAGAQQVRPALSYIPMKGLASSQTYRATIDVAGWRDRDRRSLDVRIVSAELLGPIDPVTGDATGEPEDPKADRSGYVEGQLLLVSVTEGAAAGLPDAGMAEVHLVFVPSGEGAVFWIDKVVE